MSNSDVALSIFDRIKNGPDNPGTILRGLDFNLRKQVALLCYRDGRQEIDTLFADPQADWLKYEEFVSPSGKYLLKVCLVSTHSTPKHLLSHGLVYKIGNPEHLFEVRRNYSSFPHSWVEGHPNGHDYLVTGEDYQGQTVLELDTGKRADTIYPAIPEGMGFCWIEAKASPGKTLLAVEGCFWGCPGATVIYDFAEPLKTPLPQLTQHMHYEDSPVWVADNTCKLRQYETGKEVVWNPPTPLETLREHLRESVDYWRGQDLVVPDGFDMTHVLMARLSPEERAQLDVEPGLKGLFDWQLSKEV